MSCNTKTSLAAVIDAVNAQLNNNYVDRDDPRINQGVFTEPTIRGGLMLDEAAKLDFCGYVTECGQREPFGKQWIDRPLYPDNMLVSYDDAGEIKSKWQDTDDVIANTSLGFSYAEFVETRRLGLEGFTLVDSFEEGATLTERGQALRHKVYGKLYRWAGPLPKIVPAGATPESSGGISTSGWVEVSDIALRQDIIDGNVVKNKDVVSLSNFEGVGDAVTDNTGAFRRAISYLEGIGGGELTVPKGVFLVTEDIQLPSNVHIKGAGRGITTIKKGPFTGTNYNMFWTQQTKNTSLKDMSIDGSKELRQVKGAPEGTYYKRYNPEGQQTVIGDYTTIHSTGVKVVSVGTYKHTDYVEYLGLDFKSKPLGTVISVKGVNYEIVEHGVGEWGHGILLRSADTISLERLEILNCWGDGIEIARTFNWLTYLKVDVPYKPYCKDVTIRDVEIHNCRRQGISVISLKDAVLDNVYIHDIHGSAPEAGIDFEPENVDDKLSNIVITNLLTERTGSAGIAVAIVYGFYNVSDEQTLERLIHSQGVPSDYTDEQLAKGVASSIREGKDEEKISIHIDKWVSRDTEGFILSGAVSGKPRGFVNITNSYIESRNLSNKTIYTGVEITKSRHNHPKLNIENTVIHMKDADWDSAVYHNGFQQPDIPAGGWSFKGVRYLFDKESSKADRNLVYITDTTKGTKVFKDIILDDCQVMETSAFGKDINKVGFLGKYSDTIEGYNEITVKNIPYEDYTVTLATDASYFYTPFDNEHPLAFTREDNSISAITLNFDRFAYSGGGTVLKFHNNNCALGSNKTIVLRFPSRFTLEGIHWGDVTLSREIIIPPKGEVLLRINKVTEAEIVYISPSTLAATKSNVYLNSTSQNYVSLVDLAPSTRLVVTARLNAGKPNSPVSYNFIPALPIGLVHSVTGSKTSPDYEINIDNISAAPISYSGYAYLALN